MKIFFSCGTAEELEANKHKFPNLTPVEGNLYISNFHMLLVTNEEWADYLKGKTNIQPSTAREDG